jgi:peptidase E
MRRTAEAQIVLLGPQRHTPTAREALAPLIGPRDPVAVITAGWEHRESEQAELTEHLARPVHNLDLYARMEDVLRRDPELHAALKQRFATLRELQRLYRVRLRFLAPAAEELLRREGRDDLIEPERKAAFEDLRTLDARHVERVGEIEQAFEQRWQPSRRPAVDQHRGELQKILAHSSAICIAGGHVRVLLVRLRFFDVLGLLERPVPIVAWSAGAMALAERIVLFHDSPPQGKGYAEVLGPGLGACKGIVPLPHASMRLQLDDPVRVQLLSRRFPEAICAALDPGTQVAWDGRRWTASTATQQLTPAGAIEAIGATKGAS